MLNGFFLAPKPRGNYGYITVTNPLQLDAVFVLVQDKVLLTAVYIQGGNDFKIEAMPLGTFTGYYVLGEDWNHSERQFTRKVEYHRWTESLAFTETTSPGWIWYKQYSIALVAGSADSTKPIVSADSFPALPK